MWLNRLNDRYNRWLTSCWMWAKTISKQKKNLHFILFEATLIATIDVDKRGHMHKWLSISFFCETSSSFTYMYMNISFHPRLLTTNIVQMTHTILTTSALSWRHYQFIYTRFRNIRRTFFFLHFSCHLHSRFNQTCVRSNCVYVSNSSKTWFSFDRYYLKCRCCCRHCVIAVRSFRSWLLTLKFSEWDSTISLNTVV